MATGTRQQTATGYFPAMISLASEIGCQLQQAPTNPETLRGFCPFHESETVHAARTLEVNARTTRFVCQNCRAQGNPITFIAMIWGMSARDAHTLLGSLEEPPTAQRPPYPEEFHALEEGFDTPPYQNTAVLTRASTYYAQQSRVNYPPLQFLARLDLRPNEATAAGMGYCPGTGLREFLQADDVEEQELACSTLFHPVTKMENLTGRITFSDRDHTGATLWITSIIPEDPAGNQSWRTRKPSPIGLPGRKPYLFNLYGVNDRNTDAVLTDDARLHLVLMVNKITSVLHTHRTRAGQEIDEHCRRTATAIMDRGAKRVILAMHHGRQQELTREALAQAISEDSVRSLGGNRIMAAINPATRNLEEFTFPATPRGNRSNHRGGKEQSEAAQSETQAEEVEEQEPEPVNGDPLDWERPPAESHSDSATE